MDEQSTTHTMAGASSLRSDDGWSMHWRVFRSFVQQYQWIHLGLGLLGNTAFLVGSVFFLYEPLKRAGIWLFIFGAAGMLVGSVGSAVVKFERPKVDGGGRGRGRGGRTEGRPPHCRR